MLSKEQFMNIKAGDVLVFRGRVRIVWQGPKDRVHPRRRGKYHCCAAVEFSKLRTSVYPRQTTVYFYNELVAGDAYLIRGRARRRMIREQRQIEHDRLRSLGFNVVKQTERELKDQADLEKRSSSGFFDVSNRAKRFAKNALKSAKSQRHGSKS